MKGGMPGVYKRKPKTFAETVRAPKVVGADGRGRVVTRVLPVVDEPEAVSIRVGRASAGRMGAAAAARLGIREGAAWTAELREEFIKELALGRARVHALRAAAARPLSRRQLRDRLTHRGLDAGAAQRIADELAERGVINEAALARHVAQGELSRGKSGTMLVVAKLRRRGIEAGMAGKATADAASDVGYDPREGAMTLARKKARTLPKGLDARAAQRRVYGYLARRGFDPGTCIEATRAALGNTGGTE